MYNIKFSIYNNVLCEIMSEEDTLEDIIDISLEGRPSKEEKNYLQNSEKWAEYAFATDKVFYMTVYKDNQVVACISYDMFGITIDFLDFQADKLIVYLTLVYDKYDMDIFFDKDEKVKYENNNLFLSKIVSYSFDTNKNTTSEIFFRNNGLATITITEIYPDENDWNTQEMDTQVNISHNFIRCPDNYLEFEYLLDYQKNIKSEYFDLQSIQS